MDCMKDLFLKKCFRSNEKLFFDRNWETLWQLSTWGNLKTKKNKINEFVKSILVTSLLKIRNNNKKKKFNFSLRLVLCLFDNTYQIHETKITKFINFQFNNFFCFRSNNSSIFPNAIKMAPLYSLYVEK